MHHVAVRLILPGVIALCGLLLAVASSSTHALGENQTPAWCYNGKWWLLYAEGIPGSATQDDFGACLRSSAGRGHVGAIRGQLVDGIVLLEVGESTLRWNTRAALEADLYIMGYSDRVEFYDACERRFQLRDGILSMIDPGYPCYNNERIRESSESVNRAEFTIFVIGHQFVVDGPDGWYHIRVDQSGPGPNPTRRTLLWLLSRGEGVWATTEYLARGPGLQTRFLRKPLVGTQSDPQQYNVIDWSDHIADELIPLSFERTAHYFLPDWVAYQAEVNVWLSLIMDDLFRNDDRPFDVNYRLQNVPVASSNTEASDSMTGADTEEEMMGEMTGEMSEEVTGASAVAMRTIVCGANVAVILHHLARLLVGVDGGMSPRFAATLLLLWERYVPDFDADLALQLAQRYSVEIVAPVPVQPVSGRTQAVHAAFAKPAPVLPSDYEPIAPEDLHLSATLGVGRSYEHPNDVVIVTSELSPTCLVDEAYSDGTTYRLRHGPRGEFTVNPGGTWNGLRIFGFSGASGRGGMILQGTPTQEGRVRIRITTLCPDGYAQEPRLVGYSEIIVVDLADEDE